MSKKCLCGAKIRYIKTENGSSIPVKVGGEKKFVSRDGQILSGWIPHWDECTFPRRGEVRSSKRKKK